jgi:hypothetical protein
MMFMAVFRGNLAMHTSSPSNYVRVEITAEGLESGQHAKLFLIENVNGEILLRVHHMVWHSQ